MSFEFKLPLFFLFLCLIAIPVVAAEDEEEERTAVYLKLSKGLVINYGEPSLSRLKYIKIAVQVRLQSSVDAVTVRHHLPAMKDALITLFSALDEALIQNPGGREEIRLMALDQVQQVIQYEEGAPLIKDLLFGSFIVQR